MYTPIDEVTLFCRNLTQTRIASIIRALYSIKGVLHSIKRALYCKKSPILTLSRSC